ncbi:MAG: glycosyltransferase family 4 protein [Bryobacteraceae bacterium]
MTILFVHNTSDLYGASRSLLRLVARLQAEGHRTVVVLPEHGPLEAELSRAGAQTAVHPRLAFVERRAFTPLGLLRLFAVLPVSILEILRLMRRHSVDVVHTNTALILSSPVAALLGRRPHVWHIREFFSEFPGLWRVHRRIMLRLADAVVAVSAAVGRQFAGADLSGRVRVIHDGFPREEFEGVTGERVAAFRARFGLNGGPVAGLVGRIKLGRKGQDVFIEAISRMAGRLPEAKFLLIGSPFPGNEDQLAKVEQMIARYGLEDRVIYTGDVADIKAAFAALDVTVLPTTLPEPFGGVVVESMAMGKPVIGTRLGGTVEQIEDGATGILVSPGDAEGLAQALEKLLADSRLRSGMGASGRRRFLERFEFEPFYAQISRLYEGLIRCRTRGVEPCQESS